jgi:hypothetical protein
MQPTAHGLVSSVLLLESSDLFYFDTSHKYRHRTGKSHGRVAPRNRIQLRLRLGNTKKAGAYKHTFVMHQHTQDAEASRRPANEEYEDSSVSSAADIEKEMIAANALNEGATNPYEDPIAEDHHHHQHADGGDVEKQTTRRSIQSGNAVAVNGLEKQTTTRSVRSGKAVSVNNVSAIPNGGTKAWLQVLGAFFLFFNSWGISKDKFTKCKQMANFSNSQHFRRISDLLPVRYSLFFDTFGYFLDWISTSFLAHACWRIDGAHLRCWIFPCLVECRVVCCCLRLHDVVSL